MKKLFVFLSLCILFFGCTKNYGDPTTKHYPISSSFTELRVSNAFQVIASDEVTDVVVTVDDLAHNNVVVKVIDGKLHIGFKPSTRYNGSTPKAVIPATADLRSIELSGASSFTGDLNGNNVDIELSGASSFIGHLNGHDADIDLSGSSRFEGILVHADDIDMDLSGASLALFHGVCQNKMDINLSGASQLDASLLETPSVGGSMSGASIADVTVCSNLNVSLSGASKLIYGLSYPDCNPNVNCPCSGGSTVRPR